ncbi:MAG: tetratricopeptide repeat protein [Syntrophobacterales bacterium]|jgi:Flp pilus assembly protein TadD
MKRYRKIGGDILVCLLLVAATLTVYWQVRNYEFIRWDDPVYVTENPHVQAGLSRESVVWAFSSAYAGFRIPLTWLSLMLDFEFYGLHAGGYHVTNLLFHIANTLLLFLVLKLMTGALWRSGFVAALFALHPLHVESVAWVTERKDVLSTLFWMLAMWGYLRYVERPGVKRYLVVVLTFTLGLMAKPMVVTLPFVLFLLDFWPLERFRVGHPDMNTKATADISNSLKEQRTIVHRLLWEKVPLFVVAAASGLMTFLAKKDVGALWELEIHPVNIRIANALVSYVKYIEKMMWPRDLAVLYPHPGESLPLWQVVGAGLLLLIISIFVIRTAKRRPYLTVGWLWYLGTLVPVIGLLQVGQQAMADRFTYIPLIGLFIMIAWGVSNFVDKIPHRSTVLATSAGVLIIVLMICTWKQVRLWQDSTTLFEHTLSVTSNNYSMHHNLGNMLRESGKVDEAITHYTKALEIRPNHDRAHNNLGIALAHKGRLDDAIYHHSQAIRINPNNIEAYQNLGLILARQRNLDDAIIYFNKALELDPYSADVHTGMGTVLLFQGKLEEATVHFSKALEINPNHAEAHNHYGVVLARQGRLDNAIIHFSQAVRIKPSYKRAKDNLQRALRMVEKSTSPAPP